MPPDYISGRSVVLGSHLRTYVPRTYVPRTRFSPSLPSRLCYQVLSPSLRVPAASFRLSKITLTLSYFSLILFHCDLLLQFFPIYQLSFCLAIYSTVLFIHNFTF